MKDLYADVIMEHFRNPRGFRTLSADEVMADVSNSLCGDRLRFRIRVREGIIEEIAYDGHGCMICMASASLMAGVVRGVTVAEALSLGEDFRRMLAGTLDENGLKRLGAAAALGDVARYPVRRKCAELAWRGLAAALRPSGENGRTGAADGRESDND